jgi:hypothetical protein
MATALATIQSKLLQNCTERCLITLYTYTDIILQQVVFCEMLIPPGKALVISLFLPYFYHSLVCEVAAAGLRY